MVRQTGPTKRQIITMERAKRLRRKQTTTEMLLWRRLRNHRLHELKCRRQVPIGPWIVDFYIAAKKLLIEIDGNVHEEQKMKIDDPRRQKYLEKNGYRVIRFTNDEVNNDIERVLASIARYASLRNSAPCTLSPDPSPFAKGEGRKNRSTPFSQQKNPNHPSPLSCRSGRGDGGEGSNARREGKTVTAIQETPSHT